MLSLAEFKKFLSLSGLDEETQQAAIKGYQFMTARQSNEEKHRAEHWNTHTHSCKECGVEFRIRHKGERMQAFCSEECKITYKRRQAREAYHRRKQQHGE